MKESFVLYTKYKEQFLLLSDAEKGKLIMMIFSYVEEESVPDISDRTLKMAFSVIKTQLDKDLEKYRETCKKRAESGKKGGKAKAGKCQKKIAKQADYEYESDCEDESEKESVFLPMGLDLLYSGKFSKHVEATLEEWMRYKAEKQDAYQKTGLMSLFYEVKNGVEKYGEEAVCALIRKCMANNWKGIVWERLEKKGPVEATERNYTEEELSRKVKDPLLPIIAQLQKEADFN